MVPNRRTTILGLMALAAQPSLTVRASAREAAPIRLPSRFVYVSPEGSDANGLSNRLDAARAQPMRGINAAIAKANAAPDHCTLILVAGGASDHPIDYGPVEYTSDGGRRADCPLLLVSERRHGALIRGLDRFGTAPGEARGNALRIADASHLQVHNFRIEARHNRHDASAVKIETMIRRSKQEIPARDIWICGCLLYGVCEDVLKSVTYKDIHILGNYITGSPEEHLMDIVGGEDATVMLNTFDAANVGVGACGWKRHFIGMRFERNVIDMGSSSRGAAIEAGGFGQSVRKYGGYLHHGDPADPSYRWRLAQAQDCVIRSNHIRTRGRRCTVWGGLDQLWENNLFENHASHRLTPIIFRQTPVSERGDVVFDDMKTLYPRIPEPYASYVHYFSAKGFNDLVTWETRGITVRGNFSRGPVGAVDVNGQNPGTHDIEPLRPGDLADIGAPVGHGAWDHTAVYRMLGVG
jgi:hypothetical protein